MHVPRTLGGALVALTLAAPAAASTPAQVVARPHARHVSVPMSEEGFSLPTSTRAGWITFNATTTDPEGHQLEGFRTRHDATPDQVVDDIKRAVSYDSATAIAGLADTHRDAVLVGGPSADGVTPVAVTMKLGPGTWYFFDFNDFFTADQDVTVVPMEVVGPMGGHAPSSESTIEETMVNGQPAFAGHARLPATRTIKVTNTGDEIHEVLIQRVRRGTTDAEVQAYYESGSTVSAPYARESAIRGAAAMNPGRVAYLRFPTLPQGHYALLCFAPDAETGLPHVVEGMHRVVRMADR